MILQLILLLRLCASKHTKNVLPCSLTDFTESGRRFFCKIYHDFSFPAGALPRLCFLNVEIVEIVEIGLFD